MPAGQPVGLIVTFNGVVPVEPDGSAYFEVPAMRSVFFVALDEKRQPIKVPQFVPAAAAERRRHAEAVERRRLRLAAREPRD